MACFIIHSWLNSNGILLYAISDQTSEIKTGNPEEGKKNGQLFLSWRNNIWLGYMYLYILHKQIMNTLDIFISYLIDSISDCCCSSSLFCLDTLYWYFVFTFINNILSLNYYNVYSDCLICIFYECRFGINRLPNT